MIKNERQYRVTRTQADRFDRALATIKSQPPVDSTIHPLLQKAQEDALRSQLEDLQADLKEYESLKAGKRDVLELNSFQEVPSALIRARIALNMSQKDLADRLGVKEQQVQRYEATDYASASLTRVQQTIRALGLHVREDVFLPGARVSESALYKRLTQVGLDRDFIATRLLPRSLVAHLEAETPGEDSATAAMQAASVVGHVFGWSPSAIFGSKPLHYPHGILASARFKLSGRANERRVAAYTVYAHFLALTVLEGTLDLPHKPIPSTASSLRTAIVSSHGTLDFPNALQYAWSVGVPVLPLRDSGAFHGASWRVGGRNVIVLKQRTNSSARWLFDLLHELWHVAQDPAADSLFVLEAGDMASERRDSSDEQAASRLAGNVLLDGRAEELAAACVTDAKGRLEFLKNAVPRIAAANGVAVDALANYLAFRLALQGENWWPTAATLQAATEDPWRTARDLLLDRIKLDRLNHVDRELLLRALGD